MAKADIVIFSDGACSGNPGPGGWGAVLLFLTEDHALELGGGERETTNNRMELQAAIAALKAVIEKPGRIALHSDSKYVIDGITQWVPGWKARDWRKADKKPVLNRDLWEELDAVASMLGARLSFHYVAGHSGHPGNDRADAIAVSFSQGRSLSLYRGSLAKYSLLRAFGMIEFDPDYDYKEARKKR